MHGLSNAITVPFCWGCYHLLRYFNYSVFLVTTCFTGETECTSGVNIDTPELFRCYSDSFHCDGVYECSDGTDERNCNTEFTCPSGYTKCLTG